MKRLIAALVIAAGFSVATAGATGPPEIECQPGETKVGSGCLIPPLVIERPDYTG